MSPFRHQGVLQFLYLSLSPGKQSDLINRGSMHYNFVRLHKTLRVTPAMAAGVDQRLWTMEDMVRMIDDYAAQQDSN
jgi:hypothetical protein